MSTAATPCFDLPTTLIQILREIEPPAANMPDHGLVQVLKPTPAGGSPAATASWGYQRQDAQRLLDDLAHRFVDPTRPDRAVRSLAAVQDGALGNTTVLAHLRIDQPELGVSYQELRRLLTYLAAIHGAHLAQYPEVIRADDLFFVGLLELNHPTPAGHDEQMVREQLFRLVTTLHATATLPASLNLRFRFAHTDGGTIFRILTPPSGSPVSGATAEEVARHQQACWRVGYRLLGHHLFGLRRWLPGFWRSARPSETGMGPEPIRKGANRLFQQCVDKTGRQAEELLTHPTRFATRLAQITEISLQGIRCFERVHLDQPLRIPVHPLTFLVGGNGSGKSAVGEALTLAVADRLFECGQLWPPRKPHPLEVKPFPSVRSDSPRAPDLLRRMIGLRSYGRQVELCQVHLLCQGDGRDGCLPISDPRLATWFLHHDSLRLAAVARLDRTAQLLSVLLGEQLDWLQEELSTGQPPDDPRGEKLQQRLSCALVQARMRPIETPDRPELNLTRAFGELLLSMTAFDWTWDDFSPIPADYGSWFLVKDGQDRRPISPENQLNTGDRSLFYVASFLLEHVLAWASSSGVIFLDDPFADLDRHAALTLLHSLLRMRRYLSAIGRQHTEQPTSSQTVAVAATPDDAVRRTPTRNGCPTTDPALPKPPPRELGLPAQLLITCTDRDLALQAMEAEAFPATTRLLEQLARLLPWNCRTRRIPAIAVLARDARPTTWHELRMGFSRQPKPGHAPFVAGNSREAQDYVRRTIESLSELRLQTMAATVEAHCPMRPLRPPTPRTLGVRASQLACSLCQWLEEIGYLPALLGDVRVEAGNAGLYALPPPLRQGKPATTLFSERGTMLLRLSVQDELLFSRLLERTGRRVGCCPTPLPHP